jgi:hypothetical protein
MKTTRLILIALARSIVIVTNKAVVRATNLRGPAAPIECTINAIALLQIPGEPSIEGGDEEYGCDDGSGSFRPLHLDEAQRKSLQGLAASGEVSYGKSVIDVNGATFNQDGSITMPPGKTISAEARENHGNPFDRRLTGTGVKHFLVFRVTDVNGLVHSDSPQVMSDNVFGTKRDRINMKTQLEACSVGQYTVVPGAKTGIDISRFQSATGVIDIQLDISLENSSRATVRTAAINKAREVMGTTDLTEIADHTLFSLENCYQECGWAAYAIMGGYYQVRELTKVQTLGFILLLTKTLVLSRRLLCNGWSPTA